MSLGSFLKAFGKAVTDKHIESQNEVIQAHRTTYNAAKSERARQASLKKWDKAVWDLENMEALRQVQQEARQEGFIIV